MIKAYNSEHYSTVSSWFKQWNWKPFTEDNIPLGSSFLYYIDNKPALFSCYYHTNSDIAVMGCTIKDKDLKVSTEVIDNMIKHIKEDAKSKGFSVIFYATGPESKHVVHRFSESGGTITDKGDAYITVIPLQDNVDMKYWLCEQG